MADSLTNTEMPTQPSYLPKRMRLPRLSGKISALWLVLCFGLTAILIPMALRLPRWVEFELVLAAWWIIWLAVLTRLLYTGQRVADDHQMHEPRNWFASDPPQQEKRKKNPDRAWWDGFSWGWFWGDGDAILIIVGLIVLLGAIWLVFEVAIPVLLFLLYLVTRGMLARVVNDRHHCRGRFGRALGWSLLWATLYTVPLAAAVWFVHSVHQKSQNVSPKSASSVPRRTVRNEEERNGSES